MALTGEVFSTLDWIIVILFLLLLLGVGYVTSKRTKTGKDFALGGRSMNSFGVGISLFATLLSALSYLSYPGEMIKYGPVFFFGIFAYPVAYWTVKHYIIPRFMEMNVSSAYEVLELKLGKGSRTLATVFFLALRFLWMSTLVYAIVSAALVPILGIPSSYSTFISIVLMAVTVAYSSSGGLKAVVYTDVIQTAVMFLGLILTIIFILFKAGDLSNFMNPDIIAHWKPMRWGLDPAERMTVCNIVLMNFVWHICTAGSDQMAVQRYLATKDVQSAAHSYKVSLISTTSIQILLGVVGFLVMAFFYYNPDAMASGTTIFGNADTLFPRFILVGLPKGLTGFIAAAIMAAAMSSLSSGLNSSATVIEEDIIKRIRRSKGRECSDSLKRMKLVSVALGAAVTVSCVFVGNVTGNLLEVVIKVVNLVVAPLFVLFFMALYVKKATDAGAIAGGLFALGVAVAIAFWGIFGIQAVWIMPISLVAGIVCGMIVSLLRPVLTDALKY